MSSRQGSKSNSRLSGRADFFSGGRLREEEGVVIRDWGGRYPIAIIYPNKYFIGMSNLGIQALYGYLNACSGIIGERVFWENDGKPLLSIESSRPLMDFACLAFSFSYELDYLNLAAILRDAGIPLWAKDRGDNHPLLIAGGPCITANPSPVAPFFDVLCIGEAEAILPDVLPILSEGLGRIELLTRLNSVPGLCVPSLANRRTIQRRWLKSINEYPTHSVVLTRDTELGDLYLIEVERGCSAYCNFCLVSRIFCPLRFHSYDSLIRQVCEGLKYRTRIGLVGPVVTDHPQIEDLLDAILKLGAGFSVSSMRIKSLTESLLGKMVCGGVNSIALAPEAGSDRLRYVIRKGFDEKEIMSAIDMVAKHPFKRLKLYFMVGLPSETTEDVASIVDLALKCQKRLDSKKQGCRIRLNIAPFVPKAGTPFQRMGMMEESVLSERINYIRDHLSGEGLEVNAESPQWSHVQATLSRGDSSLAGALAVLDKVSLANWRSAGKKMGVNLAHFALQTWQQQEKLPWGMIRL
ncbi:MAG: B12-binding domain-containing radical SAM protein [Dehalococcoidia bacterium]|nr:B12-binding domain-containing radical SAM protein [Dehalococcoidia bacterium]